MSLLPQFQNSDQTVQLMQSKWSALLNPMLSDPTNKGLILTGITLESGDNIINHKLGRVPQGWVVVDTTAAISPYRSQPLNATTLTLNVGATATVSLWVF